MFGGEGSRHAFVMVFTKFWISCEYQLGIIIVSCEHLLDIIRGSCGQHVGNI